jgi:hypothetical protein
MSPILTAVKPESIFVCEGRRTGEDLGPGKLDVVGRIPKTAKRAFRKLLRRRSVIEPAIGHIKSHHPLERNFLKGNEGDRIKPLMAAIGYNLAKLLGAFGWLDKIAALRNDCVLPLARVILNGWVNRFLPRIVAVWLRKLIRLADGRGPGFSGATGCPVGDELQSRIANAVRFFLFFWKTGCRPAYRMWAG